MVIHHLHQYARSAGNLDWANQPDPFRTFIGAPRIDLPLGDVSTPYDDLYRPGAVQSRPLDLDSLGMFWDATPFIIRSKCVQHESVFLAAIRPKLIDRE